MNWQDDKIAELEKELLKLQKKAEEELAKPRHARIFGRVESLRIDYRRLHRRWKAMKQQRALDV